MTSPLTANVKLLDLPVNDTRGVVGSCSAGKLQALTWADLFKEDKDNGNSRTMGTNMVTNDKINFLSLTYGGIPLSQDGFAQSCEQAGPSGVQNQNSIIEVNWDGSDSNEVGEKYSFFGEYGFDSVKIDSKSFKFAMKNGDLILFEIKGSLLYKINFNFELAPQIIRFISQLRNLDQSNFEIKRRFGEIRISLEINRAGYYVKMAKNKGGSIHIPMGPNNSSIFKFLNIFSNFVGLSKSMQDDSAFLQHRSKLAPEDPTSISKLILHYQIQTIDTENQHVFSCEKQPQLSPIQAYSDASDDFNHSDDSFFTDDFLGHATDSDRRPPLSYPEEIRKSKFNREICRKANLMNSDNCLPTANLNTQVKIYRKNQKNKRRHSMTTRSQSRDFPWD
ncbi:unnamed protein product [Cuscuta epithymum]|uniref:Uncharacterized protein n=1 Tax=Cuscuta epithymum TaxID=186058 RepID=A0AAV0DNY1_9ASTE|nr:unnamed protein product [Cuscuta epithymum]